MQSVSAELVHWIVCRSPSFLATCKTLIMCNAFPVSTDPCGAPVLDGQLCQQLLLLLQGAGTGASGSPPAHPALTFFGLPLRDLSNLCVQQRT